MDNPMKESVSIILPTFREGKNIPELIDRLANINFEGRLFEVILVDDNSQDGTVEIVRQLEKMYPWLRLMLRQGKKGLSESVMDGFRQARYSIFIVMDADLSHPPEKIPEMLAVLAMENVDLVIGSRYIDGGSSDIAWPIPRKMVSRIAALFARWLIGVPVRDPLSGFLAIRKNTYLSAKSIEPVGWKIGLEMMVKCHCKNIREVPIHFSERKYGQSKLSLQVMWDYIKHLRRLLWFKVFSQ